MGIARPAPPAPSRKTRRIDFPFRDDNAPTLSSPRCDLLLRPPREALFCQVARKIEVHPSSSRWTSFHSHGRGHDPGAGRRRPWLLYGIAVVESGLDPAALNLGHLGRTGSYDIGLMQINSRNLPALAKAGGRARTSVGPCTSIQVGAHPAREARPLRRHLGGGGRLQRRLHPAQGTALPPGAHGLRLEGVPGHRGPAVRAASGPGAPARPAAPCSRRNRCAHVPATLSRPPGHRPDRPWSGRRCSGCAPTVRRPPARSWRRCRRPSGSPGPQAQAGASPRREERITRAVHFPSPHRG